MSLALRDVARSDGASNGSESGLSMMLGQLPIPTHQPLGTTGLVDRNADTRDTVLQHHF